MPHTKGKDRFSLTVPSQPMYLAVVRAAAGKACEIAGLSEPENAQIVLAVDEACSNIIKYAYFNDPRRVIDLAFRVSEGRLEVLIDDSGPKISLDDLHGRSLDEVRPGGLGLHLIRRAFDVITYDGRKKRGNRLKLVRTSREKK